jgi:hypothetical protein
MRLSKSHVLYKRREKAEAPLSIYIYIYVLVLLSKLKTRVFGVNKRVDSRGRELFVEEFKDSLARVDRFRPSK